MSTFMSTHRMMSTFQVERMSTVAQILNFGQTPTQLFDKPHPARGPPTHPAAARIRARL